MTTRENTKYFDIYKSSAGSGKTYALAKNYIRLALQDPDYFQHILAVTFTNKASEEMKIRIIKYLDEISKGEHELVSDFSLELGISKEKVQKKAWSVLRKILHDYSRFSVTTIDTFFHRVIRTFAREIGLQGSFQVELDTDYVLDVAIDDMLSQVDEDNSLRGWLIRFAEDSVLDGKDYDFKNEIKKLGKVLFEESYKRFDQKYSQIPREQIAAIQKECFSTQQTSINEIRKQASALVTKIESHGLGCDSFLYGPGGVGGFIYALAAGDLKDVGVRVKAAMASSESWCSKKSAQKDLIDRLAADYLQEALIVLVKHYQHLLRKYTTARVISRHLYTFGILEDIRSRIIDYRDKEEVILISDLSDFLRNIIRQNDAPYIYEKVGNRYFHFLIDEFQDTSGFQWDNFKPLVENSIAAGYQNIVVGDTKQSIYRWRGGDWQILLNKIQADIGQSLTTVHTLNKNYRSHRQIVDFNNEFFSLMPNYLTEALKHELEEKISEDAPLDDKISIIKKAYASVSQTIPQNFTKDKGYVQVKLLKHSENDFKEQAIDNTIAQVEALQDMGYPLSDMAILVRKNKEAEVLVQAFLQKTNNGGQKYRYDVVSADALYLNNAALVRFFLNVFQSLVNPKDSISLLEVCRYYQMNILHKAIDFRDLSLSDSIEDYLPQTFLSNRYELLRMPLYELSERIIQLFQLQTDHDSLPYLQAFQDAILDFSSQEKGDLLSFLSWWELRGIKRTVQPGEIDAIQILTIHKAKGLQFPLVLIPFCQWSLNHETNQTNLLWVETAIPDSEKTIALPIAYSRELLNTDFWDKYIAERINALMDNLNLLYVALTRAEQALFILSPETKKFSLSHVGELIHQFVKDDLKENIYERGVLGLNEAQQKETNQTIGFEEYLSGSWKNRISIRQSNYDLLALGKEESIQYGNLIHEILSHMDSAADLTISMQKVSTQYGLKQTEIELIEDKLANLLAKEPMKTWFNGQTDAKNEISLIDQKGNVRRLDRVLFYDDFIEVLDFKTGLPKPQDQKQVRTYLELLVQMGYQKVKGSLYYLAYDKVEEVRGD